MAALVLVHLADGLRIILHQVLRILHDDIHPPENDQAGRQQDQHGDDHIIPVIQKIAESSMLFHSKILLFPSKHLLILP